MSWIEFLNQILEKKQIAVLRYALRLNAPIHFYGKGLGKSTVVTVLNATGYRASDAADIFGGCGGSCSVPNDIDVICFNIRKTPEHVAPNICELLKGRKDEIVQWVNS
jgi:hypothetical protein